MQRRHLETIRERNVRSETGTAWRVREAAAHEVPGQEAASCLIFDSGAVVRRRLWHYPERWAELADNVLMHLMDRPRGD